MSALATRLVFLLAMLVPVVVGLWLYSFVLASPLGALTAQTPHANSSTPTVNKPGGPESLASGGAASSPVPIASPTATPTSPTATPTLIPQPAGVASTTPITVVTPTPLGAQSTSESTAQPSATPPVTAVPTSTQTPSAVKPEAQLMLNPVQTVQEFYRRIDRKDFAGAQELWSSDMRRRFPPDENIWQRFAQTRSIRVEQATLTNSNSAGGQATVSVQIVETVGTGGESQVFSGTWSLVRGSDGWLLDQPSLQRR
jgi:hypothetical protein